MRNYRILVYSTHIHIISWNILIFLRRTNVQFIFCNTIRIMANEVTLGDTNMWCILSKSTCECESILILIPNIALSLIVIFHKIIKEL